MSSTPGGLIMALGRYPVSQVANLISATKALQQRYSVKIPEQPGLLVRPCLKISGLAHGCNSGTLQDERVQSGDSGPHVHINGKNTLKPATAHVDRVERGGIWQTPQLRWSCTAHKRTNREELLGLWGVSSARNALHQPLHCWS